MKHKIYAALFVVTAFLSQQAHAGLIQNGSFENLTQQNQFVPGTDLTNNHAGKFWGVRSNIWGWDTYYGAGVEIQQSGLLGNSVANSLAQQGNFYAELDSHSSNQSQFNSGIFQRLENLKKGSTYELSFWYQPRSKANNSNVMNVYWFDTVFGNAQDFSNLPKMIVNQSHADSAGWKQYSLSFIASSTNMTIGFGAGGLGDGKGALLDNVTMRDVPAPASVLLVGLGLLGLVLRKQLRR